MRFLFITILGIVVAVVMVAGYNASGCAAAAADDEEVGQAQRGSSIQYEKYSKEKMDRYLKNEKMVLVVVRSKYSFWSQDLLDKSSVRESQLQGKLAILDLVWEWGSRKVDAGPYFDEFGFSKEAFVVFHNPQSRSREMIRSDMLMNEGLPNLWLN